MRSPAGFGSRARQARKQAAATASEALAWALPLVVELGEVGGEGRVLEPRVPTRFVRKYTVRGQLKPSSAPEPALRAAGDRRRRETGSVLSGTNARSG